MAAPDLTPQTPGEPLATMTPLASSVSDAAAGNPNASESNTAAAQAPTYFAKHNGGGRWWVVDAEGTRVGNFVGDKESIKVEVDRVNAGGLPVVEDDQDDDASAQAPVDTGQASLIDPSTLKQPVFTDEGWLCPAPKAKE